MKSAFIRTVIITSIIAVCMCSGCNGLSDTKVPNDTYPETIDIRPHGTNGVSTSIYKIYDPELNLLYVIVRTTQNRNVGNGVIALNIDDRPDLKAKYNINNYSTVLNSVY